MGIQSPILKSFIVPLVAVLLAAAPALTKSSGGSYAKCSYCARDSHGKIKRSSTAKREFKSSNPCPLTGKSAGACPGYVIDHKQALKHGGADSPDNMQWQTTAAAKA
jgi:hypothetical protein